MKTDTAKPFVKWAGGKRQLIEKYEKKGFIPENFNRYFEPMLGGGAMFFHVAQNYSPQECILSDVNLDLISVYRVIKNHSKKFVKELSHIKKEYKREENQEDFYYGMREYFNILKLDKKTFDTLTDLKNNLRMVDELDSLDKYFEKLEVTGEERKIRKSALFIFLNKTCYNGLYRVNSKGEFNVPYGRYKNPGIFKKRNIRKVSKLLKGVKILNEDFEKAIEDVRENDFVYFDPPYIPLTETADFTSYSEGGFDHEEQLRLAKVVDKLSEKGAYVLESNSGSKVTKDIYRDFDNLRVNTLQADRFISCKGDERGPVEEVVITNYEPKPDPQPKQATLSIEE